MGGVAPVEALSRQAEADLCGAEHGDQGGQLQGGHGGDGEPDRGEGEEAGGEEREAGGGDQEAGGGQEGGGEQGERGQGKEDTPHSWR